MGGSRADDLDEAFVVGAEAFDGLAEAFGVVHGGGEKKGAEEFAKVEARVALNVIAHRTLEKSEKR